MSNKQNKHEKEKSFHPKIDWRKKKTKKFEVIFHCRRMFFPRNLCLLIFLQLECTQISSPWNISGKKRKNTFQSHRDNAISAYLFEGEDIHCFDKLCMNLHTPTLSSRCASCFRNLSIFIRRFEKPSPKLVCLTFFSLYHLKRLE